MANQALRMPHIVTILTQADTFPANTFGIGSGISIANVATEELVFRIGALTIPVPAGLVYTADLPEFTLIEWIAGTGDFALEIRGR